MFSSAVHRNAYVGPFKDLQERLLDAFSTHVPCKGTAFMFLCNLIDFVDEHDSLLGFDYAVSGRRLDEHRLILTHSLRTAVSVLPCESTLEWNGSVLTGTTRTAGGQLSWRGELLEASGKGD